jgi:hypothetical protein
MDNENRRVYAADWFMRAASIPCGLILVAVLGSTPPRSAYEFLLSFLAIFAGPVVIAGGWGAALGASILDPEATRSAGRAVLRGLAVAGASYVTYLYALCFWLAGFSFDARGAFFKVFILLLVYGTILIGWLVAAVGAVAGALLYQRQKSPDAGCA